MLPFFGKFECLFKTNNREAIPKEYIHRKQLIVSTKMHICKKLNFSAKARIFVERTRKLPEAKQERRKSITIERERTKKCSSDLFVDTASFRLSLTTSKISGTRKVKVFHDLHQVTSNTEVRRTFAPLVQVVTFYLDLQTAFF